jgi:hypothetical protein
MTAGVAYFGSRIPRHVAADMEELARLGFTGVLHTFTENDLRHYWGTMRQIVAHSQSQGLTVQVNPWGVGLTFGGEAESMWTAVNPELCQRLDDGRLVGAACPNRPEYRAFLREWADRALDLGADALFWDEPHWAYPGQFGAPLERWACACEVCRELFGGPFPPVLTPEVRAFRDASLTSFVRELVGHVAAQGGRNTVCLLPSAGGGQEADVGLSDWAGVAATPGVHTLATDPYWKHFGQDATGFVSDYATRTRKLAEANGIAAQIWIQGFRLGPEDVPDAHRAVDAARMAGVDDLWVWAFEAGGHMDSLGTREPRDVWRGLVSALTGGAAR